MSRGANEHRAPGNIHIVSMIAQETGYVKEHPIFESVVSVDKTIPSPQRLFFDLDKSVTLCYPV